MKLYYVARRDSDGSIAFYEPTERSSKASYRNIVEDNFKLPQGQR